MSYAIKFSATLDAGADAKLDERLAAVARAFDGAGDFEISGDDVERIVAGFERLVALVKPPAAGPEAPGPLACAARPPAGKRRAPARRPGAAGSASIFPTDFCDEKTEIPK
jgi:hypothetical protein